MIMNTTYIKLNLISLEFCKWKVMEMFYNKSIKEDCF